MMPDVLPRPSLSSLARGALVPWPCHGPSRPFVARPLGQCGPSFFSPCPLLARAAPTRVSVAPQSGGGCIPCSAARPPSFC